MNINSNLFLCPQASGFVSDPFDGWSPYIFQCKPFGFGCGPLRLSPACYIAQSGQQALPPGQLSLLHRPKVLNFLAPQCGSARTAPHRTAPHRRAPSRTVAHRRLASRTVAWEYREIGLLLGSGKLCLGGSLNNYRPPKSDVCTWANALLNYNPFSQCVWKLRKELERNI